MCAEQTEQRKISILLVDNRERVSNLMEDYLSSLEFEVYPHSTGETALRTFRRELFDLVILTYELPDMSGIEVLRKIRARNDCPVIVLSEKPDDELLVSALDAGADDYLAKPFSPKSLVARIRALLRRAWLPSTLRSRPVLEFVPGHQFVLLNGEAVELKAKELEILSILASTPGRVFSRKELFERVWGKSQSPISRRVDLYISRLRARLDEKNRGDLIASVFKRGYKLNARVKLR